MSFGSGRLSVRRSKTDQTGEGATVALTPQAMIDLSAYCPPEERTPGASVFGLTAHGVGLAVKKAARYAGLGDGYSGHSGRVGLAQEMVSRNAPLPIIEQQGHWAGGGRMVSCYTRNLEAGKALDYLV